MNNIKFISVDFQKEFTAKGGYCYRNRESVTFVKDTLIPFLRKKGIKLSEIISDYRQPRTGGIHDFCRPGKIGYESEIPEDIKSTNNWIKAENSPLWTRKNIGIKDKNPGIPYQDSKLFNKWLESEIGLPSDIEYVVLIGLTVDCCVLCVAQELDFRGYKVRILNEAVDSFLGTAEEKKQIINNYPLSNWAEVIYWENLKNNL